MFETQLGVVVVGLGGGEQGEHACSAEATFCFLDQLLADALFLVIDIHRQVGQVGDVAEIGQRAGNADQALAVPGRHGQVGVLEHVGENIGPVDGAAFAECGTAIERDGGIDLKRRVDAIFDRWVERHAASSSSTRQMNCPSKSQTSTVRR